MSVGNARPCRLHCTRWLLLGLVVTMLGTGCGSADAPPAANPRVESITGRDGLVRIRYTRPVDEEAESYGLELDIIARGADQSRAKMEWFAEVGRVELTVLFVRDGNRALLYSSDTKPRYTLMEAADEHLEDLPWESNPLDPDSALLEQNCPGHDPAGTRTILGREAVGYACTWKRPDEGMWQPEEIWVDKGTRMLLEYGSLQATEFVIDPEIDDETFSTEPPAGADVNLVKETGRIEQSELIGTNGPDQLTGTASDHIHLEGRGGDDNLRALGQAFSYMDGGGGDDRLEGGQGMEEYHGGPGDDYAFDSGTDASVDSFAGGGGDDVLIDMAGPSFMVDDAGRDTLRGGEGDDFLLLTDGADRAWAGAGDDRLQVDPDGAVDHVWCGPGDDTVQFGVREPADRYWGCEHLGP